MALTPKGFQGTVTESDIAKSAPHFGPPKVEGAGDFKVTAVSGLDRTVAIAAGFADACFVRVENTASANRQSATLSSGTRWDTVVLRRDWVADTVTLVIVTGTSAKAVAADVENDPGNVHDQVLALVQITAGVQAPTAVEDMRVWHSPVLTANSLLALTGAPLGTEAVIAGTRYRRDVVAGNVETVAIPLTAAGSLLSVAFDNDGYVSKAHGLGWRPRVFLLSPHLGGGGVFVSVAFGPVPFTTTNVALRAYRVIDGEPYTGTLSRIDFWASA